MRVFTVLKKGVRRHIALIGEGLIGSAVSRSFSAEVGSGSIIPLGSYTTESLPSTEKIINDWLKTVVIDDPVDWIWCAGRAGFNADTPRCNEELIYFTAFLNLIAKHRRIESDTFQLISSAGGLFEGCGLVEKDTAAQPSRPYGRLKLKMEEIAESYFPSINIYRATSVYGSISERHRSGLITSLIKNAYRLGITEIWGSLSTLRDYVWAEDIGQYVVRRTLLTEALGKKIYLLASGRPTSIHEVMNLVSRVTQKQILTCFREPKNSSNIVFSSKVMPRQGWYPTALETAVRKISLDVTASDPVINAVK